MFIDSLLLEIKLLLDIFWGAEGWSVRHTPQFLCVRDM
jgi:hypothetical protein